MLDGFSRKADSNKIVNSITVKISRCILRSPLQIASIISVDCIIFATIKQVDVRILAYCSIVDFVETFAMVIL